MEMHDTTSWLSKALPAAVPTAIGTAAGALGGLMGKESLGDVISQRDLLNRTGRGAAIGAGAGLGYTAGSRLSAALLANRMDPRTAALVSLLPGLAGAYLGAGLASRVTESPGDKYEQRMIEETKRQYAR